MDDNEVRYAVIDIGSNGIRFSLGKSLVRHLPCVYEERLPISLFEALNENGTSDSDFAWEIFPNKNAIPDQVIYSLIKGLKKFVSLANNYGVTFIEAVATEALRTASNSADILKKIDLETGVKIRLLSKQEEARISSLGIISGLNEVDGLTMDLGGGSLEFNYVKYAAGQICLYEETSHSFPLGAALLKHQFTTQDSTDMQTEILKQFEDYLTNSKVKIEEVKSLYLSGGGFRSLGYIILHHNQSPLRIINGFCATRKEMETILEKYSKLSPEAIIKEDIFRISKRRSHLVKPSCFLAQQILTCFKKVKHIYFSEGGVRQGVLFDRLDYSEKSKDPLEVGVLDYIQFRPHLPSHILNLMVLKLSPLVSNQEFTTILTPRLSFAAAALCQVFSHHPKEAQSACSFTLFLTGGELASLPGLLHEERVAISLILAHRYGAVIPEVHFAPSSKLIPKEERKACKLLGQILDLLLLFIPSGHLFYQEGDSTGFADLELDYVVSESSKSNVVVLKLSKQNFDNVQPLFDDYVGKINKKQESLLVLIK